LAQFPLDDMLTEIEAVGFAGIVVDRTVISQSRFSRLRQALAAQGTELVDDVPSHLAFAKLKDNGYRIEYDKSYREAARIVITDRSRLTESTLSNLINKQELGRILAQQPADLNALVIEHSDHPEVFLSSNMFISGKNQAPILPLTDMKGEISCALDSGKTTARLSDTVILTLKNQSAFNWTFDAGPYPLGIGVHLRRLNGTFFRFDDGLRLSTENPASITDEDTAGGEELSIPSGATGQLRFPLSQLNLRGLEPGNKDVIADFRMVQDGHAWFEHLGCKVVVRN
jgi:hypothetical protein